MQGDCPVDKIIHVYEKVFGDVTRWLLERIDGTTFPVFHEMVNSGPRIVVWMRQVLPALNLATRVYLRCVCLV